MVEGDLPEKSQGFHYVRDSASFVFFLNQLKPILAPELAGHGPLTKTSTALLKMSSIN